MLDKACLTTLQQLVMARRPPGPGRTLRRTNGMKHAMVVLGLAALAVDGLSGATGQDAAEVLTNPDIVTLTEAGLPATAILAKIEATRTAFDTSVEELVALSQAGVDPVVIAAMITTADAPPGQSIAFGDDTSRWAHDDECDDPRFQGSGMAPALLDADRGHDASDCRRLFETGHISLRDVVDESIAFGDDTSRWAHDGECDDPRFQGSGMAFSPSDEHRGHDATDCRDLFESGSISLKDVDTL